MKHISFIIAIVLFSFISEIQGQIKPHIFKPKSQVPSTINNKPDFNNSLSLNKMSADDILNYSCNNLKSNMNAKRANNTIEGLIKNGFTDKEENALVKLFNCFDCDLVEMLDYSKQEKNHFLESIRHRQKKNEVNQSFTNCWEDPEPVAESTNTTQLDYGTNENGEPWLYNATCGEIRQTPTTNLTRQIRNLLRGSTLDDDEKAIVKTFTCISCNKNKEIVKSLGKEYLETNMHGAEYNHLMEEFRRCNITSMEDDDLSRDQINSRSCNQIRQYNDENIIDFLSSMLSGSTGDDDEKAILKLLNCLPTNRAGLAIRRAGIEKMKDNFQGAEYDKLLVVLQKCDLINFRDFDDDASLIFIQKNNCRVLESLSVSNAKILLRKLFEGSTGDEEEKAINKLINCLPRSKVQAIIRSSGFHVDDFDDEVDGREWNQLENIFRRKGVNVN